jgi:hypothetical protein
MELVIKTFNTNVNLKLRFPRCQNITPCCSASLCDTVRHSVIQCAILCCSVPPCDAVQNIKTPKISVFRDMTRSVQEWTSTGICVSQNDAAFIISAVSNNGSHKTLSTYRLDGPRIKYRWGRNFSYTSRPALEPP